MTEKLKMIDQLRWIGIMNAIKGQVEDMIWNEIIYKITKIHYYNTRRIQRNLGVLTPMEKYNLALAA